MASAETSAPLCFVSQEGTLIERLLTRFSDDFEAGGNLLEALAALGGFVVVVCAPLCACLCPGCKKRLERCQGHFPCCQDEDEEKYDQLNDSDVESPTSPGPQLLESQSLSSLNLSVEPPSVGEMARTCTVRGGADSAADQVVSRAGLCGELLDWAERGWQKGCVVIGGPGTGKTTLLTRLVQQPAGDGPVDDVEEAFRSKVRL